MKEKVEFKGSVVLNPVPVVLITSKNKEGKENAACRFDIIGILDGSVTHIENAFEEN